MSRPSLVAGVALTLALTVASCRGDDDTADSTPESSVTETTADATTDSTTESTTDSTTDTSTATTTDTATTTTVSASTTSTTDAPQSATTTLVVTTTTAGSSAGTNPAATSTTGVAPPASTTTTVPVPGWLAPSGDYTVAFPAEPMMFELPPPDDTSDTPVALYAVETDDYGVLTSRTDYADYGLDASAIDVEATRDLAVDGAAGELTGTQNVTVQGRDGIRFQFAIGEPQFGVGDGTILLDGTVVYQAIGIGVAAESDFLTAFVDSLTFVEDR